MQIVHKLDQNCQAFSSLNKSDNILFMLGGGGLKIRKSKISEGPKKLT